MSNKYISQIWAILEKEKNIGLVKRLCPNATRSHIYATYQYPEGYYGIAFTFNKKIRIDTSSFNNLKELKILLVPDSTFTNSHLLIIQLLQANNCNIFEALCENLIQSTIPASTEEEIAKTVVNQLGKWKTLFDKNNSTGLTPAEQQGLYGELHFLQKLLSLEINPRDVLHAWVGADKALRDFQGDNWALEVKTTSTNNPQKIIINGERQLDETLLKKLFLYHLSVEISNGNGQTLCQKVLEIRKTLGNDISVLSIFNAKLFEAGYFDKHESLYQKRYYLTRNENYYKIENEFPRIKENELRKGISDVKYTIILATCDEYLVNENQIFNTLKNYERNK